ncbi:DUF892 family protein [Caballeronia cordobensis]|uniref:DUF892 family protein n=1 Tax=Caballeronia cordobensis TaxID=1353886 RepID=UPI0006AD7A42|nr:DUF892 family protein [Caballeronia cordobensis]
MTEPREHLLDWLRDAHATEQQAEQMLLAQSGRLEHYPQLKARIDQHLEETLVYRSLTGAGNDSHITQVLYGAGSPLTNSVGEPTADLRSNPYPWRCLAASEALSLRSLLLQILPPREASELERDRASSRRCRKQREASAQCAYT